MDTVSVASLIASVRARTDTENDNNVPDSTLIVFINSAYKKLYNEITTQYQAHFDKEGTPFSLVSGTYLYDLPSDFLILKGVDLIRANGGPEDRITLKMCSMQERNRYERRLAAFDRSWRAYQYLLQGNKIRFVPVPDSTDSILLTYIPVPVTITSSAQSVDVLSGFDEFIACDAGIKVLQRQERDVQALMVDREEARRQVHDIAKPRDAGGARTTVDVACDVPWHIGMGGLR